MNSSQLPPPDARIAQTARRQGGHVTRRQLLKMGVDDNAIAYRRRVGRLIRVHRGVYAVGRLPASPLDQAHGALLAAGDRSGLSGQTALALWRAERTWPTRLELISPRDIRLTNLIVHHSKTLLRRDIRSVQGLRVTSPARTALDVAAAGLSEKELTRVVNDLRLGNRLKLHQLRDAIARNPRHAGAARLRALIGESQREPTRSELENAFTRLIKRYRLPTPLINVHVGGERVDAYFPDHELIVELDGRVCARRRLEDGV